MKKIVIGIVSIIIVLFMLAYGVLFTQPGNNLLKPAVETRINSALNTKMKLEQFSLRPSYISLKLKTPMGSTFTVDGKFGLFSKNIDVKYALNVGRNENKFKLKGFELKGPFWVKGSIKGSMDGVLTITGKSNFADSKITYNIKLKDKKPSLVIANIEGLALKNLLRMLNKPAYADANIKANIKLTSFEKGALKGKGDIDIANGVVNASVMKKSFNINLPKTTFRANAGVVLNGSLVDFEANFDSNLGKSKIKGSFNQNKDKIDAKYEINLVQLALLQPITNMDLRGSFETSGTAKGTKNLIHINGKSAVADSRTTYSAIIKDLKIERITILSQNAKLDKILAMLNKPIYAYGFVNADVKITNINPEKPSGSVKMSVSKGIVNSAVIKKLFNMNMPRTTFKANISSDIKNGVANSKITVNSSIASLITKKTVFNIPKFELKSDYVLKIPNLDKLYFLTNRHMRGSSTISGDVHYSKKGLEATAYSKMWDGDINIKVANNIVTGKAKSVSVVKIMDMMKYNRIFDSKGDINFNYNLLTKKGTVNALFINGHILPNRVTFLLHNMAKFDITREIYKTTKIDSRIDNKKIYSDLDMVSRLTHITSKNAFIDLNRDFIDAKIKVAIKKSSVDVKLRGNLGHPRIKIDFKNLIRHKVEKKVKKKVEKLLKGFLK